mgnify:CR=1 FL=1
MNTEAKACQNCKQNFVIEPDDFAFYEKINVPPPTFCFLCRIQRRMAFRNERTLYKRKCDAPEHGEEMISIFAPDNPQQVYDHKAWWGDSWDGTAYGREIDFNVPFLEQIKSLWREVPDIALLNINPVNSEYCSITEGNKNCYLVFGGDFNENTLYSTYIFHSKESLDTYWVQKSELNYETVDCISCSQLMYSRYAESCYNSAFLFNCVNCHDCLGCVNMKNAAYCIFNEQYSKEEYAAKLKELDLESAAGVEELRKKFQAQMMKYPRKFARNLHAINSTGDNLEETKNCRECFDVFGGAEDCAHVWLAYSSVKDSMDVDRVGMNTELGYDCSTIYPGSKVFFSRFTFSSHDIYYSYNSHNSSYLFGCVGLRNKQYCILNKQYTKEEYEALVPRIIEHMNTKPYIDKKGRVYKYGEFFPVELSPFGYNETIAQEMFPLTRAEAEAEGWNWREPQERNYAPTKRTGELPDRISEVGEDISNEIIECEHKGLCNDQCTVAFKIVPAELQLYRRIKIPLPRLCPSCRHYRRVRARNPIELWERKCMCKGANSEGQMAYRNLTEHFHGTEYCSNKFETTYAPERPEIVYCESCYNNEVS